MKHILTLAALVFATSCFGQDTTVVCGYQYTPPIGGGLLGGWPFSDVFIPSENEVVSIFADFERPNYSGSALDFAAAFCSGCSELELSSWTLEWPSSYLWNYDTIPFPMYQTELDFTEISNAAVVGPGFLRILAPINELGWGDLCVGFRSLTGCADEMACNFSNTPGLISDPELCIYDCCPGPSCCGQGMHWDWTLSECVIDTPSDTDFDGCVGMTDLLDLLSLFGTCAEEELEEEPEVAEWSCGSPLAYQGYDYETVQIGGQCWFAENLRSENYENGEAIASSLSDGEWSSTNSGAVAVYGEESGCNSVSPDFDACNPGLSLEAYGRLYNWYAVNDNRGLCPTGWHVPTDDELTTMTDWLGGDDVAGNHMKTTYGWDDNGNGTNLSGYSGLPCGYRNGSGGFQNAGFSGDWWSSSPTAISGWSRYLVDHVESVGRDDEQNPRYGFSIRCIKDSE